MQSGAAYLWWKLAIASFSSARASSSATPRALKAPHTSVIVISAPIGKNVKLLFDSSLSERRMKRWPVGSLPRLTCRTMV